MDGQFISFNVETYGTPYILEVQCTKTILQFLAKMVVYFPFVDYTTVFLLLMIGDNIKSVAQQPIL